MIYSQLGATCTLTQGIAVAQEVVDVKSAQIAVLNECGTIVSVNSVWREFAIQHQLPDDSLGLGTNYLTLCRRAADQGVEGSTEIASAILDVLANRRSRAIEFYSSGGFEYEMRILHFEENGRPRVVIAHSQRGIR